MCECVGIAILNNVFVYGWIWMLMSMFLMNIVIVYVFAC
jgi:hypothetical protein